MSAVNPTMGPIRDIGLIVAPRTIITGMTRPSDAGARRVPVALTVAGSDSGGGAGIQADLKTFTRLGVYGTSVVTAVTAQNSRGVAMVAGVGDAAVAAQLRAVLEDIPPDATKVGMLHSSANVRTLVAQLRLHRPPRLVVDPVFESSSGARLLDGEGVDRVRDDLAPLAFLITPNLDEAEALTGETVRTPGQMETAARRLREMGARNALVKGGHLEGRRLVDVFFDGREVVRFAGERIETPHRHGTGCVLSAAVAAYLARGAEVRTAVSRARAFTRRAIENGLPLGQGIGPCDPVGIDL